MTCKNENRHRHTHSWRVCVCVCSFCLGSVCSGFPLASLPLCTASLPDTWGSAGPVRAVQDWQQWNSAYTHRHHVIRYDYWEGTVDARSCSSIPSPVQCSSSNTRSKWSEWLKLVSVGWDFPVPSSWDRSHDLSSSRSWSSREVWTQYWTRLMMSGGVSTLRCLCRRSCWRRAGAFWSHSSWSLQRMTTERRWVVSSILH